MHYWWWAGRMKKPRENKRSVCKREEMGFSLAQWWRFLCHRDTAMVNGVQTCSEYLQQNGAAYCCQQQVQDKCCQSCRALNSNDSCKLASEGFATSQRDSSVSMFRWTLWLPQISNSRPALALSLLRHDWEFWHVRLSFWVDPPLSATKCVLNTSFEPFFLFFFLFFLRHDWKGRFLARLFFGGTLCHKICTQCQF